MAVYSLSPPPIKTRYWCSPAKVNRREVLSAVDAEKWQSGHWLAADHYHSPLLYLKVAEDSKDF
jgi:hypothetical protein